MNLPQVSVSQKGGFGSCGVDESALVARTSDNHRWPVGSPRWHASIIVLAADALGKLPQRAALISGGAVRRRPFPSRLSRLSAIVQQIAPKTASG